MSALDEVSGLFGGDLDAALAYARDNDLSELRDLIYNERAMVDLEKRLDGDWARFLDAGLKVRIFQALLDQQRAELQQAADALNRCEEQKQNNNPCAGLTPSPNGVGVCR